MAILGRYRGDMSDPRRLPSPSLVVLIGPSACGKSTWAAERFDADQVVSSDRLRAMVGEGEHDLRASADAFAAMALVVEARVRRRLTTVIDTVGLDAGRREWARALGAKYHVPCYAVVFDTTPAECRSRNRARPRRVPDAALRSQLEQWQQVRSGLATEGFADVIAAGPLRVVPPQFTVPAAALRTGSPARAGRAARDGHGLRFGLQVSSFAWPDGSGAVGEHLRSVAQAAEASGFDSIWAMDHFRQIPQVGPEWADMLECYGVLTFLAAHTERMRIGALVTAVAHRNIGLLAKAVATLDVLSGGRAVCGLGAGWFERETAAYGYPRLSLAERYALLEDALQALPLLWGRGAPPFDGRVVALADTMCYPRPLQPRVPILVGGSGERRTLALVARYGDACNLFGDAATVSRKLAVLREHCDTVGRDPAAIEITHFAPALVARDEASLNSLVERNRPPRMGVERFAASVNAGTIDDQVERFSILHDRGVGTAIVSFPDSPRVDPVEAIERFAPVVAALRDRVRSAPSDFR